MIKIKNILVPTDFSKRFTHTLDYAVQFAKSMKSVLHVLHVIEPIVFSSDIVVTNLGLNELPNELEKLAKKDFEKISDYLIKKEIKFLTRVIHGTASEEILSYADKNQIDLICIATHGKGNFENLLFGSTTEKVLRKASCPVLSVRIKE